jgi:cobalamin-dependent methionine synthase I
MLKLSAMSLPTVSQLKQALKIAEKLEAFETELAAILGGSSTKRKYTKSDTSSTPAKKVKRTMSPEAREKIAAAQRKRWAKQKKGEGKK